MKVIGLIPSRLSSSRVKNKPLLNLGNERLVQRVYRLASYSKKLDKIAVATDSPLIVDSIHQINGNAFLTSPSHRNGTERISELAQSHFAEYDVFVLINGDEALLDPKHIDHVVESLISNECDVSMLSVPFHKPESPSDFKLVFDKNNILMYISRSDIPSAARKPRVCMHKAYHLMAFRKNVLFDYPTLSVTPLEAVEDHEHLRLIENGYKIHVSVVDHDCVSLDTPEDIAYILERI